MQTNFRKATFEEVQKHYESLRKAHQQAMMEKLIAKMNPGEIAKSLKKPNGEFVPIDQWEGVTVEDGAVISIKWHLQHPFSQPGTLDFQSIPPTVQTFSLGDFAVGGELIFSKIPKSMEIMSVWNAKVHG